MYVCIYTYIIYVYIYIYTYIHMYIYIWSRCSKCTCTRVFTYVSTHNNIPCMHKKLTHIQIHRYCGTNEQKIQAAAIAAKKKARQERAMSISKTEHQEMILADTESVTIARSLEGMSLNSSSEWDFKKNYALWHAHLLKHTNTPNAHKDTPILRMLHAKTYWYTLSRCSRLHSLSKWHVCCCVWWWEGRLHTEVHTTAHWSHVYLWIFSFMFIYTCMCMCAYIYDSTNKKGHPF